MLTCFLAMSAILAIAEGACREVINVDVKSVDSDAAWIQDLTYDYKEIEENKYSVDFTAKLLKDVPAKARCKGCFKVKSMIPTPPMCYDVDLKKLLLQDKFIADMAVLCSNIKKAVPVPKDDYVGKNCEVALATFSPFIMLESEVFVYVADQKTKFLTLNATAKKVKRCD